MMITQGIDYRKLKDDTEFLKDKFSDTTSLYFIKAGSKRVREFLTINLRFCRLVSGSDL